MRFLSSARIVRPVSGLLSLSLLSVAVFPALATPQTAGGQSGTSSPRDKDPNRSGNPPGPGGNNGNPPANSGQPVGDPNDPNRTGGQGNPDRGTGKDGGSGPDGTTGPNGNKPPVQNATSKKPASTNPLLLPNTSDPNAPASVNQLLGPTTFSDYRHPTEVGLSRPRHDDLALFGYDFFQSARELILAHRAYLRGQYRNSDGTPGDMDSTTATGQGRDRLNDSNAKDRGGNGTNFPNDPSRGSDSFVPNIPNYPPGTPSVGGYSGRVGTGTDRAGTEAGTGTSGRGVGVPIPGRAASSSGTGNRSGYGTSNGTGTGNSYGSQYGNTNGTGGRNGAGNGSSGPNDPGRSGDHYLSGSAGGGPRGGNVQANGNDDSINAFEAVADPLSQLYRNVIATLPPSYQLGAGDTLTVRYWSPRHESKTFESRVDSQGALRIEDMGFVVVRGQTLEQAEKAIRERLKRYFNGVETSVTIGKLRTIQVTISGASFQPGTYTVPAVATAYNLLYASGGPTEDGSFRAIEVRRDGKRVGTLDLYHFLLVGAKGNDIPLQSGDLIYIPRRRSRVSVSGEVLQPAVFELTPQETLRDAVEFAGGVKASAVAQRVRISTVVPGQARVLKDVDLSGVTKESNPTLYDGDDVEIFSLRPLLTNTVTIEGEVDQPSEYALSPNMRVSDLLERARGVTSEALLTRANLYRWNPDNTTKLITVDLQKALAHDPTADVVLTRWDRLTVFARKDVAWTGERTVTVRGAVQRPGTYNRSDNMRASDLLMLAGGPTPDAYRERAVLLHQHGDGTFGLDYLNLDRLHGDQATALRVSESKSGDPTQKGAVDVVLEDNDVVAVYRVGEAQFAPEHVVTIKGEVVTGGPFPRTQGMRLSDLLLLSGGFTPKAGSAVCIAHARRFAQGTDAGNKVVTVNFDSNRHCAPQDDTLLEDGDVVTVQGSGGYVDKVQTIMVQGAVNRPGPVILASKTMRLSDAIRAAGGLRPEAFAQGAEFYRDPKMLSTDSQRSLTSIIGGLNDLLNESAYNREKGKAYVERVKAINTAAQGDDSALANKSSTAPPIDAATIGKDLSAQQLVSPARRMTDDQMNSNGNIAINLVEAMRHEKGGEDILLTDGDTITVPENPTTVQVVGAVFHSRGVLYKPGAGLDYYLNQCGGYAPDAAKDRIEIIHVGGGLIPASKSGPMKPGDVILVPTRVLAEKLTSNQNGFSDFFKSLTNSAIVFRLATSLFGL